MARVDVPAASVHQVLARSLSYGKHCYKHDAAYLRVFSELESAREKEKEQFRNISKSVTKKFLEEKETQVV